MSTLPLEVDAGFEVKKEAVKPTFADSMIFQKEIKRLQGLYTQASIEHNATRREAEELKSSAAANAMELADLRKENDELKRKCEETENLKQFEMSRMREEQKRLQKHVAMLKDFKRKYEDLKQKKRADEEKEKEKTKLKTNLINMNLTDEKKKTLEEEDEEKVESSGDSRDIFVTLSEENKRLRKEMQEALDMREKLNTTVGEYEESNIKLRDEVKESIEIRQKLNEIIDGYKESKKALKTQLKWYKNAYEDKIVEVKESIEMRQTLNETVDEYEESNKALTKQVEWYKRGWIAYHEYARDQINRTSPVEMMLPRESIPLPPPPSYNPLMMPPVLIDDDSTECEPAQKPTVSYLYLHNRVIKTEIVNKYTKADHPDGPMKTTLNKEVTYFK